MRKKKANKLSFYTLNTRSYFYYTNANGNWTYTNSDANRDYNNNYIRDPKKSTIINLFVNGVIQPSELYSVKKGILTFKSEEPPEKGTPIILQFIEIFIKKRRKKKRRNDFEE